MRIALIHSFYSAAASSGENVVVLAQMEALAAAGHEVVLIGRETDREQAHLSAYPLRAAWRTITSRGPDPAPLLRRFAPDVVHVHNTVPNIGLQWLTGWEGPVVHTLHNYRPLCANGLLFRDGRFCSDCPDGKPWAAVQHGCYRDSRLYSLPIATRNARGLGANQLIERSDALVVLSEAERQIFLDYGVPSQRLRLVPNGVSQVHQGPTVVPDKPRWLAVGRLRAEKGFDVLLRSWPAGEQLDIIGDGPQHEELLALAPPGVRMLGAMPADEVRLIMSEYSGLIFPGLAIESALPLVVGEALEASLPVVFGTGHRQAAELVAAGVARTAQWSAPKESPQGIDAALTWVREGGQGLRNDARTWYEEQLTVRDWIKRLEGLYHSLETSFSK